jgi:hypothetical protein
MAAFMLTRFGLDGYEEWKQMFDSDPVGRKQAASGHRIFQNVDDPNDVFISVEFPTAQEAKSFRERLLASKVLDRITVKVEPTVVESVDEARY